MQSKVCLPITEDKSMKLTTSPQRMYRKIATPIGPIGIQLEISLPAEYPISADSAIF